MEATRGSRKSQTTSGSRNGAIMAPDAPSTWTGMSQPFSLWTVSSAAQISATGSYDPSKVEPRIATTPMVFSSQSPAAEAASRWKRSPSIGTMRASTSQKLQNFSQQTCTLAPMTRLGRARPGYLSLLRCIQRRLSAMPASMQASLDPVVEQPTASDGTGACHRSASIATHRFSSSAVRGYSSLSIMFLSRHSAISTPACGSIQVVTNVARFSRELPSSISSSCTN